MNKKYIEDNNIDVKYLRNQLNDEELEGFEVYLIEHPEMVEQLELDDVLKANLSTRKYLTSRRIYFPNLLNPNFWSHIAAFGIGAFSIFTMLSMVNGGNSYETSKFKNIVYLSETRSSKSDATEIFVSKNANDFIMLVLETDVKPSVVVDVSLISQETGLIAFQSELEVNALGEILAPIALAKITEGFYRINVSNTLKNQEMIKPIPLEFRHE